VGAPEGQRLAAVPSLPHRGGEGPYEADRVRGTRIHQRYLLSGERTCIDWHNGIARELPEVTGVQPS